MFKNRRIFKFHNSAKWTFVIFLKCMAYLQCGETKNSSIGENLDDCGGEFSGYQYIISSPNYPKSYPEKQNCIFTLRGSHFAECNQMFNLQFLDFSLPPSENCAEDYVEIGDRSLFCGRVIGIREYSSKDNKLILRFRSGTRLGDKRFKILVTTLPCSPEQTHGKNTTKILAEQDGITFGNKTTGKYFVHENMGPNIDFSIEGKRHFVRNEVPSPPKVESLDDKEDRDLLMVTTHAGVNKAPSNYLEVPVNGIKLFRGPTLSKTETVIPGTVQSNEEKPLKTSVYLFVAPNSANYSKHRSQARIPSVTFPTDFPKLTPLNAPLIEIHPLNRGNAELQDTRFSNATRKLLLLQGHQGINEKFVIPAKTYGEPDVTSYPLFQNSVSGIKTGEVLDNPGGFMNNLGKTNLDSDLEVTTTFRGENAELINNLQSGQGLNSPFYPTMTYQFPVSRYSSYVAPYVLKENHATIPGTTYGLTTGTYSADYVPKVGEPENFKDSLPRINFLPPNSFNGYQNFIPSIRDSANYYPVVPNSGNIGNLPLCCNTYYSEQRFLLASPGFPSFSYSGNTFECVFSIIPYSTNTCYMRFNFKFFNHGVYDSSCSNGHIDIDGRRICGCKKGLSVRSIVTTAFPKLVGVRYTGYPRTKFNGFLIEVIQEPCANSYGYLSRSKKDISDSSIENNRSFTEINIGIENTTVQRTKRNLGYSYPKPSFGLVEEPGLVQPHTYRNLPNVHSWAQEDFVSNVLSPLFSCQVFSFLDWIIAAKETYLKNSRCIRTNSVSGNNFPHTFILENSGSSEWNYPCENCEDINVIEGIISSPQYPTNYPNNVNKCFRFYKAPGFCLLELVFFDFYLEKSIGCTKDYMIFSGNNNRYCGNSLAGRKILLDISRGETTNVCLLTDSFGSQRGFSAGFSQIPCRGLVNR